MRSRKAAIMGLVGLLMAVTVSACTVTNSSGPSDQVFLDILSGPLRDEFSDSQLLAEGKKVCDARAQGAQWDQLREMVVTDLNLASRTNLAGQFMGGVDGGLCPP
jgi:hypothetical protein